MKFNWGIGIALFYSFFVLALVYQVWKSTQYDHSLVSDHYYADDLKYQEHYNKLKNKQQLSTDLKIIELEDRGGIALRFPPEVSKIRGEVHFFCPSDSKLDFRLPVQAKGPQQEQFVPTKGLKNGLWKIKVDWQADGTAYYSEEAIVI